MDRSINIPPPEVPSGKNLRKNEVKKDLHFNFATPLFGSEVSKEEQDLVTPVRVPSIRGQLRFWWRALAGNACSSFRELKEKEDRVWGSTSSRSSVSVVVKNVFIPEKGGNHNSPPNYVVFPYRQSKVKPLENVAFDLEVKYPEELEKEVLAALWGWSNFGGLGARTRRGGGSLFCAEMAPPSHEPDDLRKWFSEWFGRIAYEPSSIVPDWPVFKGSVYLGPVQSNPYSAWEKSIGVLERFRQGEGIGRNKGSSGRQGRSRWPEADSIRRITGKSSPRHKPSPEKPEKAFPRAELGLPIIMWFKDRRDGDPGNVTLSPSKKGERVERMASPLILKVLALKNNKYLPLCLCLGTPALEGIYVDEGRKKECYGASGLSDPSFSKYPGSPMSGRSDRGSAVEAFLAFACENGFKEVSK